MTMQRWVPFSEMFSLRQAMDRLLEDAVIWPGRLSGGMGQGQAGFSLPVDVLEHEIELVVKASLPGIRPEDVHLNVQGTTLTLEAETWEEWEQPQGATSGQARQGDGQQGQHQQPRYHYRERRYGRFYRQLQLPVPVDANQTKAQFEQGVLTVTLPKAAEARQRRIPVTAGSQSQPQLSGRAR
jgi:HSP20 family protein